MLETPALYSARPAVRIDDSDSSALADALLSAVAFETTDGLYRCEAVFGNWGSKDGELGFLHNDRSVLDFGKSFAIRAGAGDRAGTIFAGHVTGLEPHYPQTRAPEMTVLAEDRLQDLRMTRRTRTFEDSSDKDIIREVASGHGLTPEIDIDGPTHRVVAQLNESDLAFLRNRARLVDADLWVDGNTLYASATPRRQGSDVRLTYGANLREASILADVARQRTSVWVTGWDVSAKEAISYEAGASAISSELNGHIGGVGILEQSFGSRPESVVHTAPLTQAEVQARAETLLRTLARRFVTARGIAEGDARLRVGSHVDLAGLGTGFSGLYYLCEVQHTFDSRTGFLTRFRAERAGLGTDGGR